MGCCTSIFGGTPQLKEPLQVGLGRGVSPLSPAEVLLLVLLDAASLPALSLPGEEEEEGCLFLTCRDLRGEGGLNQYLQSSSCKEK